MQRAILMNIPILFGQLICLMPAAASQFFSSSMHTDCLLLNGRSTRQPFCTRCCKYEARQSLKGVSELWYGVHEWYHRLYPVCPAVQPCYKARRYRGPNRWNTICPLGLGGCFWSHFRLLGHLVCCLHSDSCVLEVDDSLWSLYHVMYLACTFPLGPFFCIGFASIWDLLPRCNCFRSRYSFVDVLFLVFLA